MTHYLQNAPVQQQNQLFVLVNPNLNTNKSNGIPVQSLDNVKENTKKGFVLSKEASSDCQHSPRTKQVETW
jgi:hypothetical protein